MILEEKQDMKQKFTSLVSKPSYFRWGFFMMMAINFIFYFLHIGQDQLYVVYIISTIFMGIGFYNRSYLFLFIVTTLVVGSRFIQGPGPKHVSDFIILELSYFIIMYISVGLMKHAQKISKDSFELILALSNALDSRDSSTYHHSHNVAKYAVEIAKKMKLSDPMIDVIYKGGLLHDIGKIGVAENILNKPGRLTSDEYSAIKEHPVIGHDMIKHVADFGESGILDIVLYHHERYDGKGYPIGLKENEIPLTARIMALADSFDAMTSKRVYRDEMVLENALLEIKRNKGKQFDPEITDVFLSLFDKAGEGARGEIL
jgi:putative nucleotidyltransferase with HDIG domain